MKPEQYSVLIADDSEVDRYLFKRAMKGAAPRLRVVGEIENGDEVIAYLSGQGAYADREKFPFPDLLLLDSRMPGKGGIEVLEWLRTRDFPQLQVAMLADSSGTSLKARALELGANYFFSKIIHGDELQRIAQALQTDLERNRRMKVLLRHRYNQSFFRSMCDWTPLAHEALEFASFEQAVHFAREQQLTSDVQIVLTFVETGQMFYFPFPNNGNAGGI